MKVVHLCNLPLPAGHPDYGKIQTHPGRWVLNLALAQKAHTKIQPILVVQIPGAKVDYQEEVEGIMVHYLAAPDRFRSTTLFYFDARRISAYVRKLEPDLVHAHGTEDAHAFAAQATHLPYVITVQGCYFIINRELPPRLFSRGRVVQGTEWLALRRTKHVVVKSSYVKNELKKKFPHLCLHEIPNTFDPRLLEIPIDQPRRMGDLAFVGTMVERKGVHVLRQALEIIRNEYPDSFLKIHLHIFGDRPDARADSYEGREKQALGDLLGNRLILHQTIQGRQLAQELSTIPVLVAPSLEEMFGNQVIEAIMFGTWPIVTEQTAMAENVRAAGFGCCVAQKDPKQLAHAVLSKVFEPLVPSEATKARTTILARMGPEVVAQGHLKLYQEI
jgi:glycosyltransferase involved in cell wall biosynthesis